MAGVESIFGCCGALCGNTSQATDANNVETAREVIIDTTDIPSGGKALGVVHHGDCSSNKTSSTASLADSSDGGSEGASEEDTKETAFTAERTLQEKANLTEKEKADERTSSVADTAARVTTERMTILDPPEEAVVQKKEIVERDGSGMKKSARNDMTEIIARGEEAKSLATEGKQIDENSVSNGQEDARNVNTGRADTHGQKAVSATMDGNSIITKEGVEGEAKEKSRSLASSHKTATSSFTKVTNSVKKVTGQIRKHKRMYRTMTNSVNSLQNEVQSLKFW